MTVLAEVARRAAAESPLWAGALVATDGETAFAGVCPDGHLLGLEMIYEGHLLHRGRSRLFSQDDRDLALLTGDYLYAAGLVEVCRTGDLEAVRALAELISETSRAAAEGDPEDRSLWLAAIDRFS
ncbi:MAG TPA: hypothetical protein VFW18_09780 [Gaiellales bacterium]|jgi:hypothetical protein|nr:hypothetical protein [Gaiellales bacterium]